MSKSSHETHVDMAEVLQKVWHEVVRDRRSFITMPWCKKTIKEENHQTIVTIKELCRHGLSSV